MAWRKQNEAEINMAISWNRERSMKYDEYYTRDAEIRMHLKYTHNKYEKPKHICPLPTPAAKQWNHIW